MTIQILAFAFVTLYIVFELALGRTNEGTNSTLKYLRPKQLRHNVKSKITPPMVFYGAYMGDIVNDYDYLELTIESIRWNPQIDFVLLNLVDDLSIQKNYQL